MVSMTEEEKREKWRNEFNERMKDPEARRKKRECDRRRYEKNKEKKREYYVENAEARKEYQRNYRDTVEGRASDLANSYIGADKARGFDISNNVTREWIMENVFKGKCVYCGQTDWHVLGCDRTDNGRPHSPDNVVCCCDRCNTRKGGNYGPIEFQAKRFAEIFGF